MSRRPSLIFVVAAVAYAPVFLRAPQESDWYRCFVQAAARMQSGEKIHVPGPNPYAYPPVMALLTIPAANVSAEAAVAVWYLVNLAALAILVVEAWRFAGGPQSARWGRADALAFALGIVVMSRFLIGPLENRQFDLVIAAILLRGLVHLQRGGDLRGGCLLGLAAAMKCTPLLFAPYLVWRRKYGAACVMLLTAMVLNLLPDFCFPQTSGRSYLLDWKEEFLDVSREVPPGTWFSGLLQNQSVAGAAQRYFRYGLPTSSSVIRSAKLIASDLPKLRAVVYLAYGLLAAAAAASLARAGRVVDRRDEPDAAKRNLADESACILAMMLLVSPMTSRAHFVVLLPAVFAMVRRAVANRTPKDLLMTAALAICGVLTSKGLVGKQWSELASAWSLPTTFALLCFISACRRLWEPSASLRGARTESSAGRGASAEFVPSVATV